MKKKLQNVHKWLLDHERAIMAICGMIIIGLLCYVFGWFSGAQLSEQPITVYRTTQDPIVIEYPTEEQKNTLRPEDCVYVGSTKGTKYYTPDCSYATKIDPENLRCFRSDQDAIDKGYTKSTSCGT